MAYSPTTFLYFFILSILYLQHAFSQSDSSAGCSKKITGYADCVDLHTFNSTLCSSYNRKNSTLSTIFRATPPTLNGWVSWGVNPTNQGVIGAQALIAFKDSNDFMTAKTMNIKSYDFIIYEKLSFEVWDLKAGGCTDGFMTIQATLKVPVHANSLNITWQVGGSIENGMISPHDLSLLDKNSNRKLDLVEDCGVTKKAKIAHGILTIVGWGIMYPISLIISKYVDITPSASWIWFYIHLVCQLGGYIVGVIAWGVSVIIGIESEGTSFPVHRDIGTVFVCLATAILFSEMFLQPDIDHKNRSKWNFFHNKFGYLISVGGIVNIYRGFNIANTEMIWVARYSGVPTVLSGIAVYMEIITCTRKC